MSDGERGQREGDRSFDMGVRKDSIESISRPSELPLVYTADRVPPSCTPRTSNRVEPFYNGMAAMSSTIRLAYHHLRRPTTA